MTQLRPVLGSYTAELGHSRRPRFETSSGATTPRVSLRHMSDPTHGWIGPQAVTEESRSNPKEPVLACGNTDCRNDGKDCCGPTTE